MDLRHLRYFATVVEEQSIGRAAARLHISQPPLTRQIKQLEAEVGAPLLVRTARGVEPTESGRLLFEEARNMLTLMERAGEKARLAAEGRLGRLDIGVFGSNMLGLPELLLAFRRAHPNVEVLLHSLNKNDQIAALRERRINVGFTLLGLRRTDLTSRVIRREPLIVALSEGDPLARRKTLALRDLAERPLLMYASGPRPNLLDVVFDLFRREGVEPQTGRQVADSLIPVIVMVSAGYGVALVPEWSGRLDLPGVCYRPLRRSPQASLDLHVVYRRDDKSPLLQAFLQSVDASRAKRRRAP
jgi:DNA-binding transcriptional LysR family regulator